MDSVEGKAVLAKQRAKTTIGQMTQEQRERTEAEERKTKATTDKENRERIERKKKREVEEEKAALKIQKIARGNKGREKANREKKFEAEKKKQKKRIEAVTTIQKVRRGNLDRKKAIKMKEQDVKGKNDNILTQKDVKGYSKIKIKYEQANPVMLRIDTGDQKNNFIGSVQEFNHRFHYTEYPIFNALKIEKKEFNVFKKNYEKNKKDIPYIFGKSLFIS